MIWFHHSSKSQSLWYVFTCIYLRKVLLVEEVFKKSSAADLPISNPRVKPGRASRSLVGNNKSRFQDSSISPFRQTRIPEIPNQNAATLQAPAQRGAIVPDGGKKAINQSRHWKYLHPKSSQYIGWSGLVYIYIYNIIYRQMLEFCGLVHYPE